MAENNKKDYLTGWVKTAIVFNLIFIAITAAIFISKGYFNPTSEIAYNQLESFGSFVGGICSSITSLVAIYLVLKTYNSQKEELEETRKIASEQSQTLKIQQFENTYFNMLSTLREIINSMQTNSDLFNAPYAKKDYLRKVFETYKDNTISVKVILEIREVQSKQDLSFEQKAERIGAIYGKCFEEEIHKYHSFNLAHYFRYMHNTIKYIIEYFGVENKYTYKYIKLLSAQLSNDEMALILYNSLARTSLNKYGEPEFKSMIDKYGLLENIDKKWVLFDKTFLKVIFPNTNFFVVMNGESSS